MADIASKVAQIRQATYGKDVRESIASGIEAINTEVVSTTGRQNVIDGQEQTRINNESTRQSQETTRQSQETTRISNEDIRKSQESTRMTSEGIRQTTFEDNENNRSLEFNSLKTQITGSIDNANGAAVNANTATSNYSSVVEQTRKIYKPSVDSYAALLVTYPNPEIGWTVTAKDSNIEYRWDGVDWMDVGTSNPSVGLNVVVGSTAPINPNSIWLDAPETTKYCRIVPSVTEPTDSGQIWWQMDN